MSEFMKAYTVSFLVMWCWFGYFKSLVDSGEVGKLENRGVIPISFVMFLSFVPVVNIAIATIMTVIGAAYTIYSHVRRLT